MFEIDFARNSPPPNWNYTAWSSDPNNADNNNGYENEDFIVWMRTAAMPTFRKLYRKLVLTGPTTFQNGLPQGNYTLNIDYSKFPSFIFLQRLFFFFFRLSRVKFRRKKTIHYQYNFMDGWKKSISWLGLYRRGCCLYDCLRGILHPS